MSKQIRINEIPLASKAEPRLGPVASTAIAAGLVLAVVVSGVLWFA